MKVELIDIMGDEKAIVNAARLSTGKDADTPFDERDRQLLRYLMRHRHTSPFEQVELKMVVEMPIFVARQWMRHRTAHVNELSGRYTIFEPEFWVPEEVRRDGAPQRPGAPMAENEAAQVRTKVMQSCVGSVRAYGELIGRGVAREQARAVLPLATMTRVMWKIDLHNLLHFLELRLAEDSQSETRQLAERVAEIVRERFPTVWEAFEDYRLNAVTLSAPALRALRATLRGEEADLSGLSAGERREIEATVRRIVDG